MLAAPFSKRILQLGTMLLIAVAPSVVLCEPEHAALGAQGDFDSAAKEQDEPDNDAFFNASDCMLLFGDASQREENNTYREAVLTDVDPELDAIEINYSAPWGQPKPVKLKGLQFINTVEVDEKAPAAVFYLTEAFEDYGCPSGNYLLEENDSIGNDNKILAIWDGMTLIEHDGELGYLRGPGIRKPEWRMIWHSSWQIIVPRDDKASKSSRKRKPKRRGRKRATRRR